MKDLNDFSDVLAPNITVEATTALEFEFDDLRFGENEIIGKFSLKTLQENKGSL